MKNNLHIHGCRMQSVTDGDTNDGYFAVAGNYGYNANGNMTSDPSKGTGVEYNYLNLPGRVTFGGNGEVRYTYDAAGNKLRKVVEVIGKYNLQDHLGNTRVVFSWHSNGMPEVMQVTDYYPFGLVMNQQNYFADGVLDNKYLYNGKELQDDELAGNSLGWYDYGTRMYDAELGRFHSQDRFGEKYYSISNY